MSYARAISRPRMGRAVVLPGIVQLEARRLTSLPYQLGNSMHKGSLKGVSLLTTFRELMAFGCPVSKLEILCFSPVNSHSSLMISIFVLYLEGAFQNSSSASALAGSSRAYLKFDSSECFFVTGSTYVQCAVASQLVGRKIPALTGSISYRARS